MCSELIVAIISILVVCIISNLEFKCKKFFTGLSHFIIILLYAGGLTPSTSHYRAFLIFASIYLIMNISINLLNFYGYLNNLKQTIHNLSSIDNIEKLKNRNTNIRIFIYTLSLSFSIIAYYTHKMEDINNVFATVIILDVLIDLILSKFIKNY